MNGFRNNLLVERVILVRGVIKKGKEELGRGVGLGLDSKEEN